MPIKEAIPLIKNSMYHIYNRGNNGENLFFNTENYHYFLRKYDVYLSGYLDTYAYCLLPNHFHLLVRVKELSGPDAIPTKRDGIRSEDSSSEVISQQFRRLFLSYAQAINRQEERKGSLFQKPFKRKEVISETYFNTLVHYIHSNPQKHKIIDDFREYPHSSYGRILIDKPSKLMKDEVMAWFGSKEEFKKFHAQPCLYNNIAHLVSEDE